MVSPRVFFGKNATLRPLESVKRLTRFSMFSGVASKVVSYGAAPSGYSLQGEMALDGSGNLFEHAFTAASTDDAVIEYPVGGGPGTVVYTETGVAHNDLTKPPPYFAFWHISYLFTGP